MKRLISWLLALTLIFGLVPMSAMAADPDVDTDGTYDEDVDFGELVKPEVGTQENPEQITWTMGDNCYVASVTVDAGETRYFTFTPGRIPGDMVMTANGEVIAWTYDRTASTFSIANNGEEAVSYDLVLSFPVGHQMNPVVIEEMNYYYGEVSQAAGDNQGYFYTYTATETGIVTLYFNAVYDDNGDLVENVGIRDITVTNLSTNAQYSLQQDGVDNSGLELVVPVVAGQQLQIVTSWVTDAEGNYFPEATYSWTGNFSYPAGSELNPIQIDWNWDENMANGDATVVVAENGTYFWGEAAMILTVNGVETAQENGMFVLDAGTYELALTAPVGQNVNPEVIDDINGDFATGSLAEGAEGYYYIWTATEDGTVTLDASEGANIIVTHFGDVVTYTDEDGSFEYVETNTYELATAKMNEETWALEGWDVAENISFEVKAGHSVKIQVVALEVGNWEKPAISYTLTGAFEKAVTGPIPADNLVFYRYALSFQEYTGLQFIVKNSVISAYERVYAHVSQDAPEGVVESDMNYTTKGSYSYFNKDILSWSMTEAVTITLYGEKDGKLFVGQSVTTSVMEQALLKVPTATAAQKTVLIDMLNYGAAVQTSFDHNADNLPNAQVEELGYAQYATKDQPVLNAENVVEGTGSVAKYRESLSLQSKVELQVIFKLSSFANKDVTQYKAEITMGGTTTTLEGKDFRPSGTSYSIVPVVFAPYMLRETCTVVIKDLAGNVVSPVYTYSVEGLAKAKLNGTSADDVIYAMMKFGDAVSAIM